MTSGPHLARVILAVCSSVVLTSTVVGPLAYRAHTARIDSEIIARLGPAVVRHHVPNTTTTTQPESRPKPFNEIPPDSTIGSPTATTPPVVTTDPAQVLDTSVTREDPTTTTTTRSTLPSAPD